MTHMLSSWTLYFLRSQCLVALQKPWIPTIPRDCPTFINPPKAMKPDYTQGHPIFINPAKAMNPDYKQGHPIFINPPKAMKPDYTQALHIHKPSKRLWFCFLAKVMLKNLPDCFTRARLVYLLSKEGRLTYLRHCKDTADSPKWVRVNIVGSQTFVCLS